MVALTSFAQFNQGEWAIWRSSSAEGRGDGEDAAGGEGHRLPQELHRRLPSICQTFFVRGTFGFSLNSASEKVSNCRLCLHADQTAEMVQ